MPGSGTVLWSRDLAIREAAPEGRLCARPEHKSRKHVAAHPGR